MPIQDLLVHVNPHDYDEGMPSYPGLILTRHVVTKGAQIGGVAGMVAGVFLTLRGRSFARVPTSCAVGTFLIGAPLGLAGVVAKAHFIDEDGVIDRGYRVSQNQGQTIADSLALGGAVGAGSAALTPKRFFGAVSVGFVVGLACYPGIKLVDRLCLRK